jgi:drug/metabolite transporter (DMT)-like permease
MAEKGAPADSRRSTRAVAALVFVTVLWGWTFVWMGQAVGASERRLGSAGLVAGVGLFMTLRFGLAALLMLAIPAVRSGWTRGTWIGGLWLGVPLLAGFLLQMFGLSGVSPAVSAFLTSLYVLFTAVMTSVRERRAPHAGLLVGATLATTGAAFIGGPPQLTFGAAEWLTVGCAVVFAVHILVTDHWTRRERPMPVTFASFVVVALGAAATLAIGVRALEGEAWDALAGLCADPEFLQPLLWSSVLATVLALSMMNLFQRDLDPVRAAIVYAIEPVWAALVGIAYGTDRPTPWLYFGGAALLAGNLTAELLPLLTRRRASAA